MRVEWMYSIVNKPRDIRPVKNSNVPAGSTGAFRAPSVRDIWNSRAKSFQDNKIPPIKTRRVSGRHLAGNRWKPLLCGVRCWRLVSRDPSFVGAQTGREMAEAEEADRPNNARLFQVAVTNSLRNISESVRWATVTLYTERRAQRTRASPFDFARAFLVRL